MASLSARAITRTLVARLLEDLGTTTNLLEQVREELSYFFSGHHTETACLPGFGQSTSAFGSNNNTSTAFGSGGGGAFASSNGGTH